MSFEIEAGSIATFSNHKEDRVDINDSLARSLMGASSLRVFARSTNQTFEFDAVLDTTAFREAITFLDSSLARHERTLRSQRKCINFNESILELP